MKIDRNEAARIAALAHLDFDDASLDRIASELSTILDYVDQLKDVDTPPAGVDTAVHATPLREDLPLASLDHEAVARNAPEFAYGFFVVPKVLGGES